MLLYKSPVCSVAGNNEYLEGRLFCFQSVKTEQEGDEEQGEILKVYPDSSLSLEALFRWILPFASGNTVPEDCSRRPRIFVTRDNGLCVLHQDDPPITFWFLSLELGMGVHMIYIELGLWKYGSWILYLPIIAQKTEWVQVFRLWVAEIEMNGLERTSAVAAGDECWRQVAQHDVVGEQ